MNSLSALLLLAPLATALRIAVTAATAPLAPRGAALELHNYADTRYFAELTLGARNYTVLIDSGSSDLWVAGEPSQSNDTGLRGEVKYARDAVQGPIKTADLRFGDYTVAQQAFMEVPPDEQRRIYDGKGLLGLGPSTGSFIVPLLNQSQGDPMLYRVFVQDRATPNYFTILLGRDKDPTDHSNGSITIGEVIPEYAAILNETRLSITSVAEPLSVGGDQHLQVLLDEDGIIGPDGTVIPFESEVPATANPRRATVVLDSGFALPQVPKFISDAIYARLPGSEYVIVQGIGSTWIVPCDVEVNVTFKFSGKEYPMHPLDMTMDPEHLNGLGQINNLRGERSCIGTFQPFTFDRGDVPSYDMVLGMAFMRNVYALFDYGDFIQGSFTEIGDPYIQLLSTTDRAEAHLDFVTVRGVDTHPSPDDAAGHKGSRVHSAIVAAVAVIGVLLIVATFLVFRARSRARQGRR